MDCDCNKSAVAHVRSHCNNYRKYCYVINDVIKQTKLLDIFHTLKSIMRAVCMRLDIGETIVVVNLLNLLLILLDSKLKRRDVNDMCIMYTNTCTYKLLVY